MIAAALILILVPMLVFIVFVAITLQTRNPEAEEAQDLTSEHEISQNEEEV